MADGVSDIVGHFREGLGVLQRHPVLLVPAVAVLVVIFVATVVLFGGAVALIGVGAATGGPMGAMAGLAGGFVIGLFFAMVAGVLSLIASAVVVVMARDALGGREPSLGDAVGTVLGRFVDVLVASVIATGIVGIGFMLLVVPGLVAIFFLIFTLPAVLLGGDGAIDALKRSVALVRANLGPTAGLVVGWIVVYVVTMIVGRILGIVPVLGALVAAILNGVALTYLTIVTVRVYRGLAPR